MEEKIENLNQQIDREIKQYNNYLEKGEASKNEYIPLIIQETKNNIKKEIETFVKTDVEYTNNLGLEELSKMKREMNLLIDSMDNILNILLKSEDIWKVSQVFIDNINFKEDNIYRVISDNEKIITKKVEDLIKNEFVKTGSILIKYGYLKDKTVRPWEKRGDTFIYDCTVWLSDGLRDKMKAYTNLFKCFINSKESITKLETELKQAQALYLWEQA